jgi:hypothetical protein
VATGRTNDLLGRHTAVDTALTSGFQRALFVGSLFILAAAVLGLKATNTRGETVPSAPAGRPAPTPDLDGAAA